MRVENRRLKLENGKETLNAEGAENAEFAEKRRRRPTRNTGVWGTRLINPRVDFAVEVWRRSLGMTSFAYPYRIGSG